MAIDENIVVTIIPERAAKVSDSRLPVHFTCCPSVLCGRTDGQVGSTGAEESARCEETGHMARHEPASDALLMMYTMAF